MAALWVKCTRCGELLYQRELAKNLKVCHKCQFHFRLSARERVDLFADEDSFRELDAGMRSRDLLSFVSRGKAYPERLEEARRAAGLEEAAIYGTARLQDQLIVLAAMDAGFLGASMGSVVGEKIARAFERALAERCPLVIFATSGGARMHEGLFSLMQMAKTTAAAAQLAEAGLPFICVCTDPTYAGVTASFVSIADVIIGEPGASMGFAGPRVVEQTTKHKIGSDERHTAFMLEHGMVDMEVPRGELRPTIARLVGLLMGVSASGSQVSDQSISLKPPQTGEPPKALDFERTIGEAEHKLADARKHAARGDQRAAARAEQLAQELQTLLTQTYSQLKPWHKVQIARHSARPHLDDVLARVFTDFVELHGDRRYGDDSAVVGGLARFDGQPVVVIGHQKGRDTRENVRRNFGMAHPEGYRKAQRLMLLAERFHLPVLCFPDTPGASPVMEDECRGQAEAIASSILCMLNVRVPIVVTILGEGGSGGALAIGVGDRVLMLEHAIYSVASPEGCAAIVWRDSSYAPQAAEAMRITAQELSALGLIDGIVPEPLGGAHRDPAAACEAIRESLRRELAQLTREPVDELLASRREKYRRMGGVDEPGSEPGRVTEPAAAPFLGLS
ncbi:MAG TPA: acetyl-CoA carboxylase carboxyltransferase subunit alpha [Chloroflexota bacterium]|nr:acetyl-CoA carboxylase carboxyltransferase subunit alpha [Chloroflexota bacterium]